MAESSDDFNRTHQRHVKDLELTGRRIGDATRDSESAPAPSIEVEAFQFELTKPLEEEIGAFVVDLANQLRIAREPADALKLALEGMDGIEQKRFVLNNILEALKTGRDLGKTLRQYKKLGLLSFPQTEGMAEPGDGEDAESTAASSRIAVPFQSGFARACQRIHRGLGQSTAKLGAISMNAVNAIPKLADVEVGFALCGGIPSLTFTAKKKDSLGLQDLADILAEVADT